MKISSAAARRGVWLGLAVGFAGAMLLTFAQGLGLDPEQRFGLVWLYRLRGAAPPPSGVAVVAVDRESAKALNTDITCMEWPRTYHAELVQKLKRAGAALVIFDLTFPKMRPAEDAPFQAALEAAGNVLLVERLPPHAAERLVSTPALRSAALASAPFILPRGERVDGFWIFMSEQGEGPTLPAVALQAYGLAVYDDLLALIAEAEPAAAAKLPRNRSEVDRSKGIEALTSALKKTFLEHPALAAHLEAVLARSDAVNRSSERRKLLQALIRLYAHEELAFFDLHGWPRTVTTEPYAEVLQRSDQETAAAFKDKVVFVGFSPKSWLDWESIRDDYHTVFSQKEGEQVWVSGVELAATAFSNLLEGTTLKPLVLWQQWGILLLWAVAAGLVCMLFRLPIAVILLGAMIAGYLYIAEREFRDAHVWLPLVVPLTLQAPLAFLGATLTRYYDARREQLRLRDAFRGLLPEPAVNKVMQSVGPIRPGTELVYGICLATDVKNYTALSEMMDPTQLANFMNDYLAAAYRPIELHEGIIADLRGDAIMALWAKPAREPGLQQKACRAAVSLSRAVAAFKGSAAYPEIGTRIGLHAGEIALGFIGARNNVEFRAVGTIVNTASRVESLNKHLGTEVLASAEVVSGVSGVLLRPLGDFLLAGLRKPLAIFEILGFEQDASEDQQWLCREFAAALEAYRTRRWEAARDYCDAILQRIPSDGPARFYLSLCAGAAPPDPWDPTVRLTEK